MRRVCHSEANVLPHSLLRSGIATRVASAVRWREHEDFLTHDTRQYYGGRLEVHCTHDRAYQQRCGNAAEIMTSTLERCNKVLVTRMFRLQAMAIGLFAALADALVGLSTFNERMRLIPAP